jgi:hypothetical protein
VVERLLLNGIDNEPGSSTVARQGYTVCSRFAYEAEAALARREFALAWAEIALKATIR